MLVAAFSGIVCMEIAARHRDSPNAFRLAFELTASGSPAREKRNIGVKSVDNLRLLWPVMTKLSTDCWYLCITICPSDRSQSLWNERHLSGNRGAFQYCIQDKLEWPTQLQMVWRWFHENRKTGISTHNQAFFTSICSMPITPHSLHWSKATPSPSFISLPASKSLCSVIFLQTLHFVLTNGIGIVTRFQSFNRL